MPQILDVGWRTARLCAHESYMDCPYYEQLQYAGDTRIQALVSLYTAGDARLMKNAIAQLNDSRTAEGATMSRAPTRQQQYIPPFSLWWIGMVHDYYMYVDDAAFVREMLPGVRAVLQFFAAHQKAGRLARPAAVVELRGLDAEWRSGVPPREADGSSAPLDLQLLLAYDWAARLEDGPRIEGDGGRVRAQRPRRCARRSDRSTGTRPGACSPTRPRASSSRSTPTCSPYSRVSSTGDEARDLVTRVLEDRSLVQCSYYFRHYVHTAVNMVGEGDRYLGLLGEWESMLSRGLTTFAERYEEPGNPSRSDCHAWSSSPNFEIFRTVLGIDTAAPGFTRVRIRPFLGTLDRVSGSIPHPKGEIAVTLERAGGALRAQVSLPAGVSGEFSWNGMQRPLAPGTNTFTVGRAAK